ncbi:hypothetical protein TIFTF001_012817 [Ficus carica]|uniref:CLAVATA3/ESR (CLE)-related protein n=1 Tax=Ficus carica TaxID=3494 RepID=A0AA87ZTW6_FICCA|nr:hypothetical protein TIFTF001_012817 [Ficus carica]
MAKSRNVVSVMKRIVLIIIILVLLISILAKSAESRSLKPATLANERRKLSLLLKALNQAAAAADATDRQPAKVSPGGPDPRHHFQKNL